MLSLFRKEPESKNNDEAAFISFETVLNMTNKSLVAVSESEFVRGNMRVGYFYWTQKTPTQVEGLVFYTNERTMDSTGLDVTVTKDSTGTAVFERQRHVLKGSKMATISERWVDALSPATEKVRGKYRISSGEEFNRWIRLCVKAVRQERIYLVHHELIEKCNRLLQDHEQEREFEDSGGIFEYATINCELKAGEFDALKDYYGKYSSSPMELGAKKDGIAFQWRRKIN